jgi:hypothetical protein
MNAAETLEAARSAQVQIHVDGRDLILEAPTPPTTELLQALAANKAALVALLNPIWGAEDWRRYFEERVQNLHSEGRSADARRLALEACIAEWLKLHPARSRSDRCAACGDAKGQTKVLLPFGADRTGHAWLHADCWPAWYAERRALAETALRSILFGP